MKRQSASKALYVYLCLGTALAMMLSACASPPPESLPPASEIQLAVPLPPAPPPPPSPAILLAPTPTEVQSAIARIYKGVVRVSASATSGFVVGDFNGDRSQDLAVIVEPVKEKLDDLNSDVTAWLIGDPLSATLPPPVMTVKGNEPRTRPVISEGDTALLAIIHGYGAQGWRDTEAQQSYLLKNAVGGTLVRQPRSVALAALKNPPLPPVRGDVIRSTMAGGAGFLYYNNSAYAWYALRTYRGEVTSRMAH